MTPVIKYDEDHDVLHIHFAPFEYTEDEEIVPGFIVRRSARDPERVVSITVLDYTKRHCKLDKITTPNTERQGFAEYIQAMIEFQKNRDFDGYTPKQAVLETLKAMWADVVSKDDFDTLINDLKEESLYLEQEGDLNEQDICCL